MIAVRRFTTLAALLLVASCAPMPRSPATRADEPEREAPPTSPLAAAPAPPHDEPPHPAPSASAEASAPAIDAPPGTLVELPVAGHAPAVVAMPREGRRPVLVATHGAGGTPEAHCAYWRALVDDMAFVLCPRGVTMDVYARPEARGWFYPAHPALEREVRDALAALKARFPERVDLDRAVYTGFSQGGVMGALAFSRAPAPFTALVLVEGGAEEWATYNARSFVEGGGRRVILACGRRSCSDAAQRSAAILKRAGVDVRVIDARGAGHTNEGRVKTGLVEALPWLLEGDPRFSK
ncbi:Hypothetical protein A7982_03148 [Minicystis rosea]|nr:Hypothetical protein A7982_03148 [Minicystis rosea]